MILGPLLYVGFFYVKPRIYDIEPRQIKGKSFYKITWVKLKRKLPLWNQGDNFVEKVLILSKNIIRLSGWLSEKLIQVNQVSQVSHVSQVSQVTQMTQVI